MTHTCRVWPSDTSVQRIKQKVKEVIGRRYGRSLDMVIGKLNPVLRGWAVYHSALRPDRNRLRKLNGYVRQRLRIFLKRKHNDPTMGTRRAHLSRFARLGLHQVA
jgi:RNA-directed DNA polymerase